MNLEHSGWKKCLSFSSVCLQHLTDDSIQTSSAINSPEAETERTHEFWHLGSVFLGMEGEQF